MAERKSRTVAERIREVCRYVEGHIDESLSIAALAAMASMSRFHFARSFRAVVGVTPKQYVAGVRMRELKQKLRNRRGVDAAIYDVGYGSISRVYEQATSRLGMTPAQYRRGAAGVEISHATLDTPLGKMMIGATDRGICFIQFGESQTELLDRLRSEYAKATIEPMREPYHPQFQAWAQTIARYLAGEQPHVDLPLDIRATAFQLRVWKYVQTIPYGDVQSYSEVAAAIGAPRAARSVARACACNVVALAIPCHRVIRESGDLGGYRWGLPRKRVLINTERAHRSALALYEK
ncbi:MAG: methylated-DNA--[protein]-cysteine S-methyltransferase [Candidatus Eremiobacteraeota bacterium]|nr:methylated-DNA--[protein]-cysteine S-methyltransferase [Candidatus Eremiobacteraeota bacterium]